MKKRISIIGFGRFGQVLYQLLGADFSVRVFDPLVTQWADFPFRKGDHGTEQLEEIYESKVIFLCLPIEHFEVFIRNHQPFFRPDHLLVDVLSVKRHPRDICDQLLSDTDVHIMLTHPLFGPDSAAEGFTGLPLVIDQYRATDAQLTEWVDIFTQRGLDVQVMTSDQHDALAAKSQGVVHLVGRILDLIDIQPSSIDTLGAQQLLAVREQTCHDSWQLFANLQNFNPYTRQMRVEFGEAYDQIFQALIPPQKQAGQLIFGIQGGEGSFNQMALQEYVASRSIPAYSTQYLYTTQRVLQELHRGDIDRGIFAIQNSIGGMVQESIEAMAAHKFRIVDQFQVMIRHHLMKRPDVAWEDITAIMAHPQVFKQCQDNLAIKYPEHELQSGEGELIDTAECARALAEGRLPQTVAILGPGLLCQLHGLQIVEENLQDNTANWTSFLCVARPQINRPSKYN